jgi:hypothetical protein
MNDSIPELKIGQLDDEDGEGLILLEQDSGGNRDCVAIHPIHLRYMAEKFGLVESSDLQATRYIATLERRMRLLQERIDHLGHRLANHPCRESVDIDCEIEYLAATSDLADEFCMDMGRGDEHAEPI